MEYYLNLWYDFQKKGTNKELIEEKQREIIKKLNESDEIKRFKELERIIKNNRKYNEIVSKFDKEKMTNEEIINLRKELFEIDEIKEYALLEINIRLFSKKLSDIISSIVDKDKC